MTMTAAIKGDTALRELRMFIDGAWLGAASGDTRETVDPYTGAPWAVVPEAGPEDVRRAVAAARRAFDEDGWPQTSPKARAQYLRRLASLIRRDAELLATIETRDNGKLLREMRGQVSRLPDWLEYFAGWTDKVTGEVIPTGQSEFLVYTVHEPVGVVGAITAWNSPLLLAIYKLAPALAMGCTVVLKPAEQTPVSSLELARLIEEAEFPPGVVNVVTGDGLVGACLVADEGINKIAFTGSTETGISIIRAGAPNLTRTTLELGGKSANIVFADADLEAAADGVVAGIFAASGQTCIAGSRLLVEASVEDELIARVADRARAIRLGDPKDATTEMGPLAFRDQFDKVRGYIERAKAAGGVVRNHQRPGATRGLFIEPTILSSVTTSMEIAQDEVFGPVLVVMPFSSPEAAVRIANDVRFGLAAGIWTSDLAKAHRLVRQLRVGTVWINAYRLIHEAVPIGGFGASGVGRENGRDVLREYTEVKSVWTGLGGTNRDPFTMG
jgi:aldehyde dehydrogenase (NAD+)